MNRFIIHPDDIKILKDDIELATRHLGKEVHHGPSRRAEMLYYKMKRARNILQALTPIEQDTQRIEIMRKEYDLSDSKSMILCDSCAKDITHETAFVNVDGIIRETLCGECMIASIQACIDFTVAQHDEP